MSAFAKVDRPNTLIVTVPEELSGLSDSAIVDKLVAGLCVDDICCIQFVPRCYARITFSSFEARNRAFSSGIFVDSTRLYAVEADPVFKDVYLEHLPIEVCDVAIREALGPFGAVHEIIELKYAGTSIRNGTRLLKMSLASDVPVNLRILRYPCRVFYKGQPRPCSICRSSDHRAVDCPLRDVCRRCRKPGHFARDCVADLNGPASDIEVPSEDDDDDDDDDVSDESSVVEEFVSGDEEVVNAAPPLSESPLRTRSSSRALKRPCDVLDEPADSPNSEPADPADPTPPASLEPPDPTPVASPDLFESSAPVSAPDESSPQPVEPPDPPPTPEESAPESSAPPVESPVPPPTPEKSAPSVPEDILSAFKCHFSPNALLFKDDDGYSVIDMNYLTRRCVVQDSASPDMYRFCSYNDTPFKDVPPKMSVFPPGRPPLPADILLSPDVVPAAFPVPPPLPMASDVLVSVSSPRWIARAPDSVRTLLSDRPHSSDTHIGFEDYTSGAVRVAFDFGRLTYRVIKDTRFFEEDRFHAYRTRVVNPPSMSAFAHVAVDLPALPEDVLPACFPASR